MRGVPKMLPHKKPNIEISMPIKMSVRSDGLMSAKLSANGAGEPASAAPMRP